MAEKGKGAITSLKHTKLNDIPKSFQMDQSGKEDNARDHHTQASALLGLICAQSSLPALAASQSLGIDCSAGLRMESHTHLQVSVEVDAHHSAQKRLSLHSLIMVARLSYARPVRRPHAFKANRQCSALLTSTAIIVEPSVRMTR